jgi:hypothetical protein
MLQIQHYSITIIFLLLKLSKVKIFPSTTVHTKKATLRGALSLPNTLPRTSDLYWSGQYLVVRLHFKCLPFRWNPTNCILTSISNFLEIQQLKESQNHVLFPIMHKVHKQNIPMNCCSRNSLVSLENGAGKGAKRVKIQR